MNRIKEVLKEKSKNQSWLASQVGVSRQVVSEYCRNKKQPLLETLFEIASVLKVEPSELLGDGSEIK